MMIILQSRFKSFWALSILFRGKLASILEIFLTHFQHVSSFHFIYSTWVPLHSRTTPKGSQLTNSLNFFMKYVFFSKLCQLKIRGLDLTVAFEQWFSFLWHLAFSAARKISCLLHLVSSHPSSLQFRLVLFITGMQFPHWLLPTKCSFWQNGPFLCPNLVYCSQRIMFFYQCQIWFHWDFYMWNGEGGGEGE